jgi:hypothetical protein
MTEARINESCIIGLPTCGYAFNSTRMAFIAIPADEEFKLELDLIQDLLQDKGYESFVALQRVDPAKLAFCTKICSKIITSQFCIVLLNSSQHREHPEIRIPNPNVHLEYGVMMAFKKYILPLQRENDALAFNIQPLDTIKYTKGNFRQKAEEAIDSAILASGTTARPTRPIASSPTLVKYIAVRGLRFADVRSADTANIFALGSPFGFNLLDGREVVFVGLFDEEPAKEVVFRLKLLLQNLHQTRNAVEAASARRTPEELDGIRGWWGRVRVQVIVAKDIDKERIRRRVVELTQGFWTPPWELLHETDLESVIAAEYDAIGEV